MLRLMLRSIVVIGATGAVAVNAGGAVAAHAMRSSALLQRDHAGSVPATATPLHFAWTAGYGFSGWTFVSSSPTSYVGSHGADGSPGLLVNLDRRERHAAGFGVWSFGALADDTAIVAATFTYVVVGELKSGDCVVAGLGVPDGDAADHCRPPVPGGRPVTVSFVADPGAGASGAFLGLAACGRSDCAREQEPDAVRNSRPLDGGESLRIVDAMITVLDTAAPDIAVSGSLPEVTSGQTFGAGSTLDLTATAHDDGLGVQRLVVEQNDGTVVAQAEGTCDSHHRQPAFGGRLCTTDLSLGYSLSTASLQEGLTQFHVVATDAAGNVSHTQDWQVYVDRTAPDPVTGLNLLDYNANAHTAIVSWDPAVDPPAPDQTAGSRTQQYQFRTRLDGGAWSAWAMTTDTQSDGSGLPAQPGQTLEVQVVAIDGAGNSSTAADWSTTIPTTSEVAGGSEDILPDDSSVPPDTGPPQLPQPSSTPDIAVPVGTTPEANFTRFEFDPAETGADVVLNGAGSTLPGTFALSGLVIDAQTGKPVPGASIRFTGGSTTATTTSDAEGGYAFAELPPSPNAQLSVAASGYSTYQQAGLAYPAGDEYELTVQMSAVRATTGERATGGSHTTASGAPSVAAADAYIPVRTDTYLPPTIVVGVGPLTASCGQAPGSFRPVKVNWRTYVARVLYREASVGYGVGVNGVANSSPFGPIAKTTIAGAISSYAWFHAKKPGAFAVFNSTSSQCYGSDPADPSRDALTAGNLSIADQVLGSRIVQGTSIFESSFVNSQFVTPPVPVAQLYRCPDADRHNRITGRDRYGNLLQGMEQLAVKAWEDWCIVRHVSFPGRGRITGAAASVQSWEDILNWYYPATVEPTGSPFAPQHPRAANHAMDPSVADGSIEFTFPATSNGTAVGWRYRLSACPTGGGTCREITTLSWTPTIDDVPTQYTYRPSDPKACVRYRVEAWFPGHGTGGWSTPAYFDSFAGKNGQPVRPCLRAEPTRSVTNIGCPVVGDPNAPPGPANDDIAGAESVDPAAPLLEVTVSGTLTGATLEPGEATAATAAGVTGPCRTVWYSWTPDTPASAYLDLAPADPTAAPPFVAVWTSSGFPATAAGLTFVGSAWNNLTPLGQPAQSWFSFAPTVGTTYLIEVGSVVDATPPEGDFTLYWPCQCA